MKIKWSAGALILKEKKSTHVKKGHGRGLDSLECTPSIDQKREFGCAYET